MAIGDFLAGAGQVGAGIRRAQREIRADRLAQLQMEEANRVQRMYDELNQKMRQGGLNYKGITPGQMLPVVEVSKPVEAKKPAAPAKKAGVSKPATPSTAAAPATRVAPPGPKTTYTPTVPSATAVPGTATSLSGDAGVTNLSGGASGDRLESATDRPQMFPVEGALLRQVWDALPGARRAGMGAVSPYATSIPRPPGTTGDVVAAPTPAAAPAAAPTPAAAPSDTAYIFPVDAGVRPPEARPAAAQPTEAAAPVAPRTPQEVVTTEAAVAEQPVPERTLTRANFYLTDPTKITYEMQRTMDKREELVRYANIMLASRTAQGLQAFMQVKAQIDAIDGNMVELQGMQGLQELTDHNDPRRLAGVLSLMSGGSLAIQPRTDGTYNVIAAPGTESATPILEGASPDELAVYAMKRFSPAYRAQEMEDARALQMEATKTGFEIQKIRAGKLMDMSIAEMKATADLQKAILGYRGKVDAARIKAAADKAGIKLFNGGDGVIYGEGDNGVTYRLAPATTEIVEDNWLFPDVTRDVPERLIPIQLGQGG